MAKLEMDFAYAKLQSIDGDSYFIRKVSHNLMKLPILLTSKAKKQFYENKLGVESLGITSGGTSELHGAIHYCPDDKRYVFFAIGDVFVNGLKAPKLPLGAVLATISDKKKAPQLESESKEMEAVTVDDLTQFMIEKGARSEDVDIFYFTVPNMAIQSLQKF